MQLSRTSRFLREHPVDVSIQYVADMRVDQLTAAYLLVVSTCKIGARTWRLGATWTMHSMHSWTALVLT